MPHTIPSEPQTETALRLAGLRVAALAPIDLELAAGECVCLSGPSGCGKSLLLRAIADLDPHAGEAWVDGAARTAMSATAWRKTVALVPTDSAWWAEHVGEHFATPPAAGTLQAFGFPPDALDWQIARLSSGERQRLALLRAMEGRPRVLLLDEATANLDGDNTARIEDQLREQRAQGMAILWVSHDPRQVARVADRYFQIEDGALREQAPST